MTRMMASISYYSVCISSLFLFIVLDNSLLAQQLPPAPDKVISAETNSNLSSIYRSIVRIEAATQEPSYSEPWKAGRFSGGIGTGFLIGPNLFLTNAHVVSNVQRLLITMHGSAQKHPARILHIAHDCDLALLQVDNFTPFLGLPYLSIGKVPKLESQVRVIGYPVGGNRISVTRGVVSRVDFSQYSHSRADSHLVVQIDAAINPGNSGGPVLQNDKVVGVAFQGLRSADNTGYMIPPPVIKRFLKDIEDGVYDQYVDLGISYFPLFNSAMRKQFNLSDSTPGVLVSAIMPEGPCDSVLEENDILTAINGNTINRAGNILIDNEQVNLNEIVERKFSGDIIKLAIIRNGKKMQKECTLKPFPHSRIYAVEYDKKPRYTCFSGLLLQPLSLNLFVSHNFKNIHVKQQYFDYLKLGIFKERKDIVILTRVLDDPINTYISEYAGTVIDSINDEKVTSLEHAHSLLYPEKHPEFFVIKCMGLEKPIIIPGAKVSEANQRTQSNYGISQLYHLEK